mgnify:CR=1 FL=1
MLDVASFTVAYRAVDIFQLSLESLTQACKLGAFLSQDSEVLWVNHELGHVVECHIPELSESRTGLRYSDRMGVHRWLTHAP